MSGLREGVSAEPVPIDSVFVEFVGAGDVTLGKRFVHPLDTATLEVPEGCTHVVIAPMPVGWLG